MRIEHTTWEEEYGVGTMFPNKHPLTVFILEPKDDEEIRRQIKEYIINSCEEPPSTLEVYLEADNGEGANVEIAVKDYMSDEEIKKIIEECEKEL